MLFLRGVSDTYLSEHSDEFNVTNLKQYNPYYIRIDSSGKYDTLIIDLNWYDSLLSSTKKKIIDSFQFISWETIRTPHSFVGVNVDKEALIYATANQMYDYNVWYHPKIRRGPRGVRMIKIESLIKNLLVPITNKRVITGNKLNASDWDDLEELEKSISNLLDPEEKYFVRLSSSSAKHDTDIKPMTTSRQIISHITSSLKFLNFEYNVNKDTYLIMVPWNDDMEKRYEFRLFVKNKKLTCASQQAWHTNYNYTPQELKIFQEALADLPFLEDIPYKDAVIDAYVDIHKKVCYLIECNPFGVHSCSGSALFHWAEDKDILLGKKQGELRVVTD